MPAASSNPGDSVDPEFNPESLLRVLATVGTGRYLVGFSGGLDSTVLLHAMAELRDAAPITAIRALHVDHGLQPAAAEWARHCRRQCEVLGIDCDVWRGDARAGRGDSPEAIARQVRYRAFTEVIRHGETLLLAQHLDDQVETLMLRLLRGAGSRGLSGMPRSRPLGAGSLLRPLLDWRRAALLDWARRRGLCWIEDPSNADTDLDRNFVRHDLIPRIDRRFPGFAGPLLRSAANLRADAELLAEFAETDLERVERHGTLDLGSLACWSELRQVNVLRHWLRGRLGYAPPRRLSFDALRLFVDARTDASPALRVGDFELRRFRNRLYCLHCSELPVNTQWQQQWDGRSDLCLAGTGRRVSAEQLRREGVRWEASANLVFRPRPTGLRVRLRGARHSRSLKKCLYDQGIPPWQRAALAVLYADGRPLWIECLGALEDDKKQ